jgi:hypothetical protein
MSPRRPRIELPSSRGFFVELEPPPSDRDLCRATYRQCLKWCARQGILQRDRLRRVARARGYHPRWVDRLAGRRIDDVVADANKWQGRQLAEDE